MDYRHSKTMTRQIRCLVMKLSQLLSVSEIMVGKRESTVIAPFKAAYSLTVIYRHVSLSPQIHVVFIPYPANISAIDGDYYKTAQPIKMQSCGDPPQCIRLHTIPGPKAQGTLWKRGWRE